MSQVMQLNTIAAPAAMDKKAYAVNFKGLIAHLLDILFVSETEKTYNINDLSSHMQRDLGMHR
ncbi:hypothetical protein [Vibrio sp. SCSIO 43136]|uniref:hypothetical protein n=1 Tax=Vibrio sp. SCSIO 43136 TaxID=2819101 RepID=UPI00207565E0|nr:hypothetical protein [Vibrio sp. SCSIO 43136]USD66878.1 hypothetical protein J4N39_19715 [Vibrio sp. SCSIO 43136]